jgi:alcohol dehydrogenase class IV
MRLANTVNYEIHMTAREKASALLRRFKGDNYIFGTGCIGSLGKLSSGLGKRVSVVAGGAGKKWGEEIRGIVRRILYESGITLAGDIIDGAKPNSPFEDVFRISEEISSQNPDSVVSVGGGSLIDAVKAAITYSVLGDWYPNINDYFGENRVSDMLAKTGRKMLPSVAVQLASGSAAHLTKYSNITDMKKSQKFLMIDNAVTPDRALFDYSYTRTMSKDFTMDGAFDGISHCLEVYMGMKTERLDEVEDVALSGIELITENIKTAVRCPENVEAREALGLGTDLGGYSIMIGGTNGAHLNSFSLVELLPHGRACALMNPYYVVFFSPAIEDKLRKVGAIYQKAGYVKMDMDKLSGRDLGMAVAEGMIALSKDVGFPTALKDVPFFSDEHIRRCLAAAKNPKFESKLRNMPVPLSADNVDEYMGSVLAAAKTGDFSLIRNL